MNLSVVDGCQRTEQSNAAASSLMNPHVIVLNAVRDQAFLNEQRADPVTKEVLKPGDRVVVCAHCDFVFLEDTWEAISGRIFGHGTETVPNLPAAQVGPIHFGQRTAFTMPPQESYANDPSENRDEATSTPSDNRAPAQPVYANVNESAETRHGATTAQNGNAAAVDHAFTNTDGWVETARPAATAANNHPAPSNQAYANSNVTAESQYRAASASSHNTASTENDTSEPPRRATNIPSNNTTSTAWVNENRDGAAARGRRAARSSTPNPVPAANVPPAHPQLRLREIPFQLREIPFAFREVGGY